MHRTLPKLSRILLFKPPPYAFQVEFAHTLQPTHLLFWFEVFHANRAFLVLVLDIALFGSFVIYKFEDTADADRVMRCIYYAVYHINV